MRWVLKLVAVFFALTVTRTGASASLDNGSDAVRAGAWHWD